MLGAVLGRRQASSSSAHGLTHGTRRSSMQIGRPDLSENLPTKVTVMGLGLFGGGAGAAKYFARRGCNVTVTDLRNEEVLRPALKSLEGFPIRYVLGRHREEDFYCDILVVNPAVRPANTFVELARRSGARITSEFELGLELAAAKASRIIAVTGTNGKSTTAAMLGSIVTKEEPSARCGGNLGGSLLELADSLPHSVTLVLEVSSFQLERLNAFPGLAIAVITNLAPNHLDWHPTLEHYYAAKRRLIDLLPEGGSLILNGKDPVLREWGERSKRKVTWFFGAAQADRNGVWSDGRKLLLRRSGHDEVLAELDRAIIHGRHDLENASAAAAAALEWGAQKDSIQGGLETYRPLRHRLEEVARSGGLRFIDDSSATTPESAIAALESLDGPLCVIAGGKDKGAPFDALGEALARRASGVVLVGAAGVRIGNALRKAIEKLGSPTIVQEARGLHEAFGKAVTLLKGHGTVLLSPGAASLDEFANFEERGDTFAELARSYAAEHGHLEHVEGGT